jgi:hypothetical protein
MTTNNIRLRQVMDWRAALWTGLIAGTLFLVAALIIYPLATGASPWVLVRFIAAIILGQEVLVPINTFNAGVTVVALLAHYTLSILYTLIIAFIVHRWGILLAVIVGALTGLAFYLINFFTFSLFFEWFSLARDWSFLVVHVLFGAVAGGIYELLEQDIYVVDEASE